MGDFRYLLDTNIVSELVKNPQGRLAEKMLASGWGKYSCTSIIVACELRYGAAKKQSPRVFRILCQPANCLTRFAC
jgi:tRNA(fMet)-specific endonuclease VapC